MRTIKIDTNSNIHDVITPQTGAEAVTIRSFVTGTGYGRVSLTIVQLDGSETKITIKADDAVRLSQVLQIAGYEGKAKQRKVLGHDNDNGYPQW